MRKYINRWKLKEFCVKVWNSDKNDTLLNKLMSIKPQSIARVALLENIV